MEALKAAADRAAGEMARTFLHDESPEDGLAAVRTRVVAAMERGEFEAEIMRFPSALCSDGGRAINNALENREQTLPGRAAAPHARWREHGRPAGCHPRAAIVNYPDGMPGDVGLVLSRAAPSD